MKLGIIGLGRMGASIAWRAIQAGHEVVGFDLDQKNSDDAKNFGVHIVPTIAQVAQATAIVWIMVPAGDPVDQVIGQLRAHLQSDAIIIDGGNSHYPDSIRRAKELEVCNIHYLDCGTSGGLRGRVEGFSLMIGGHKAAFEKIVPLCKAIAAPQGYALVGPSGAGHYVKMVHNGIEYALLQSYAEGFQLIKEGSFKKDDLDLEHITQVWMHGSVIRSWILDLSHDVFKDDQKLDTISGAVGDNGTGKWTIDDAHKNNVPVPLIEKSMDIRVWSRQTGGNYATKVIAMIRNKFGGHAFGTLRQSSQPSHNAPADAAGRTGE